MTPSTAIPRRLLLRTALLAGVAATLACSAPRHAYVNRGMDFGAIKTIAVLPFSNLSKDNQAADRVRDVFQNMLLATDAAYVLPPGEMARAISRLGITSPAPNSDEIVKIAGLLKADAVITGVVKEYGEVRSSSAAANVVSLSIQMFDGATGKIIWAGASTKGGIGWGARLLGVTGGEPVNDVTEQAVDDLLHQLLQ
jgi:hypothetical protein